MWIGTILVKGTWQGFSALAPLTFWTRSFFDVGAALCIKECLAASLACTHWIPEACPNPQGVTTSNVSLPCWVSPGKNHWSAETLCIIFNFIIWNYFKIKSLYHKTKNMNHERKHWQAGFHYNLKRLLYERQYQQKEKTCCRFGGKYLQKTHLIKDCDPKYKKNT